MNAALALLLGVAGARERPHVETGPPTTPAIPAARELPDGTPVWLLEERGSPLVRVEVSLLAGHLHAADPAALRMAGALLGQAPAGGRPGWQARLAEAGGVALTGVGALRSWVDVEVLAGNMEEAVELGRAAALGARFPRGDVRRLRRTWRRSGATGWRSGARVLETATAVATYPPGHPRARVDGPDAWRGVGPRRVRRAWAAATAAPRTVVVSGHFDGGPVLPLLEEAWSGGSAGAALLDSPPPAGGARLVLVDHPGATQVLVRASLPTPGLGDPGLAAVRLLTELLGGGFTSRLNSRLREELGITYGAGATLALARSHGRMLLDTTVAPDDVVLALEEMNHALLMLALRPPDDAEIESARRALLLRADQSAQRLDGRTFPHGEALALGRAVDAVAQDRLAVQSVGLDVVRSAAAELAATDDVTWLVVGDARLLESALTRAGWSPDALWQGQEVVEGRTVHVPP